jgi:hypothetical protein
MDAKRPELLLLLLVSGRQARSRFSLVVHPAWLSMPSQGAGLALELAATHQARGYIGADGAGRRDLGRNGKRKTCESLH